MKTVYVSSQFAIYDDVLSEAEFKTFWRKFRSADFETAQAGRLRSAFRVSDGSPYLGEDVAWTSVDIAGLLPPGMGVNSLPIRLYPTREIYDKLIDCIREVAAKHSDLIGAAEVDWVGIVAKLYGYPAGTSISWHSDDLDFSGSFIFYANPSWDVQWGGELFVADESIRNELSRESLHTFDNGKETEALMRIGVGHYIMPKPNRLVILGHGHPHKVARVNASAGDQVRASLAGFFVRPAKLDKLIAESLELIAEAP